MNKMSAELPPVLLSLVSTCLIDAIITVAACPSITADEDVMQESEHLGIKVTVMNDGKLTECFSSQRRFVAF